MQTQSIHNNFTNYKGTIKIYNVGHKHSKISNESIKSIEKAFPFVTKDVNAHMDVILFDRYNAQSASPDKIIFNDGNYSDYIETLITNCNENTFINNLVTIFYAFNDVKKFKDNIHAMFK